MLKGFGKKIAAALMACMVVTLAACGGSDDKEAPSAKPVEKDALASSLGALLGDDGQPLLQDPAQPDSAELADVYGIDTSLFQEYIILVDKKWNFCMLLIPAEGKSNDIKNMMSTALTQLAQQLELYEPDQCQVVRDHLETMRGEYLIYAACADNEKLLAEIEKAME